MKTLALMALIFLGFAAAENVSALTPEPTLQISVGGQTKTFSRTDLLKMKSIRTLKVKKDVSYHKEMIYKNAIPVAEIFKGLTIDPNMTISFRCLDGFSAPISQARLLNQDPSKATAFIAIEDPGKKWPPVKKGKTESAGPFYLVWENPEKSNISIEEWPYQLSGFEVSAKSVEEQYPHVGVAKELASDDPARKGYASFMKNCFACHAMNGDGIDKIGPDLNIPESPSEYLKHDYFKILVRNPQNLRRWKHSNMSKSDPATLPDSEIEEIWKYLEHMSKRKNLSK